MTKIAEPGGYQREAGAVFGSGILRSCPACEQMPCICYARQRTPTTKRATGEPRYEVKPEALPAVCACCHLEFAATRTVRPKRCHPCRQYCAGGVPCAKKGRAW